MTNTWIDHINDFNCVEWRTSMHFNAISVRVAIFDAESRFAFTTSFNVDSNPCIREKWAQNAARLEILTSVVAMNHKKNKQNANSNVVSQIIWYPWPQRKQLSLSRCGALFAGVVVVRAWMPDLPCQAYHQFQVNNTQTSFKIASSAKNSIWHKDTCMNSNVDMNVIR